MSKTIEQQVEELTKQCWIAGDFDQEEPVMPDYKVKEVLEEALKERDRIAEERGIAKGREEAVEIIKEELRNAPLEVQMTKGIVFGKVIKALQDKK